MRSKRIKNQALTCFEQVSHISGAFQCSAFLALSDGTHKFKVLAVANDGEQSETITLEHILIDNTPPVASLTLLPEQIKTHSYTLTWSSGDSGGSGVAENRLSYQVNQGAWQTVPAVTQPAILASAFSFPQGQQGDEYTFCLKTVDQGGQ